MRSTAGAIERPQNAGSTPAVQRQLVVAALWTILGLAVALAVLLMIRRISGAFQTPLSGAAIVLAGLVTEVSIVIYRQLWSARHDAATSQHSVLSSQYPILNSLTDNPQTFYLFTLTTLIALSILISLTIPGTPLFGLLIAWLIVIAGEIAQWQFRFQSNWTIQQSITPPPVPPPPPLINEIKSTEAEAVECEIPPGLIQQVTRVLAGDQESIHALINATIAANDRLAIIHLAFCPPLAEKPELTAHALDSDEAEIRITQAETFGARVEIRLPKTDVYQRSLMIELLGSVPNVGRASGQC